MGTHVVSYTTGNGDPIQETYTDKAEADARADRVRGLLMPALAGQVAVEALIVPKVEAPPEPDTRPAPEPLPEPVTEEPGEAPPAEGRGPPQALKDSNRWLCWQWGKVDPKTGKPKKDPRVRGMKQRGWKSDPSLLMSLDEARAMLKANPELAGFGFLLGDGIGGIDIDQCIEEDGTVDPRVDVILDWVGDCYAEISPSKRGIKVFARTDDATWLELNLKEKDIVARTVKGGYFTVTGDVYRDGGLVRVDIDALAEVYGVKPKTKKPKGETRKSIAGFEATQRALLAAVNSKSGPKGDKLPIPCPWRNEHTSGDGERDAVLYVDEDTGLPTTFYCLHMHCADKTVFDVLDHFTIARPKTDAERRVAELNERFFIVDVGSDTVVGEEIEESDVHGRTWSTFLFRSFADFRRKLVKQTVRGRDKDGKPKTLRAADVWLAHDDGAQFERLVYAVPGSEVVARENDLNGWKGFTVEPTEGEWPKTKSFLQDIVCAGNAKLYKWLFNWLAALMQKPGMHGETTPVVVGIEGAGKNFFATHVVSYMFNGRHARTTTHTRQVLGAFNSVLSGLSVLVLDEANLGTDAEASALRGLITGDTVDINRKGIDTETERSMLHVMILTNEKSRPVKMAATDRRFVVFQIDERKANDAKFFGGIASALATGERAAMLHELLAHKVDWNELRHAPTTAAKERVKRSNWAPAHWFVYREMRKTGAAHWPNGVRNQRGEETDARRWKKEDIASEFTAYLDAQKLTDPDPRTTLQDALREMFPNGSGWDFNRTRKIEGRVSRDFWTLPTWCETKAALASVVGCSVDDLDDESAEEPAPESGL